MKAILIDSGVLERTLESIRDAITEMELLENEYDWYVSDSLQSLYDTYEELEANINNLVEFDHE